MSRVMELAIAIKGRLDGSVASSMQRAIAESKELKTQIKAANDAMRNAQRAASAEQRATGQVSVASYRQIAALQARINDLTQRRSDILDAQARKQKAQAAFDSAKSNLTGTAMKTVVLAAPLVGATKAAMDFESEMAEVRKVVDFDTPQQFKEMGQDILDLSTKMPMAASGIAKIVAAGGQAGIARQDLMQFAQDAVKMGVAFDITADQAGDMMAKWRSAFNLNQDGVVALADKINYLGNTTAASAPLIADVVTRIGPLGEIGGVASGEIAALGASMVATGVQSDVAATGIKNLILGMTAGEGATKSQAAAFQQLGFDAADMAKRMQTDAKGAIMDVFRALQALPKDQQASVLADLFGKESIGAIAPLLTNLDALQDNFNKVNNVMQYGGSVDAEYAARCGTTANQLSLFRNSITAVAIEIGSALLPAINRILQNIVPVVVAFANWAKEHQVLIQTMVALAASFAGVLLAARSILAIRAGFRMLKETANLFFTVNKNGETVLRGAATASKLFHAEWIRGRLSSCGNRSQSVSNGTYGQSYYRHRGRHPRRGRRHYLFLEYKRTIPGRRHCDLEQHRIFWYEPVFSPGRFLHRRMEWPGRDCHSRLERHHDRSDDGRIGHHGHHIRIWCLLHRGMEWLSGHRVGCMGCCFQLCIGSSQRHRRHHLCIGRLYFRCLG